MAEWESTCNHNYLYRWLPCQYFILLMMNAWRPKHVEKVCSNKICISAILNMAEWGSTCNHNYLYRWLPCQYFILLMMSAWRPKHVEKICSNKICILLHQVGVLFNLESIIQTLPQCRQYLAQVSSRRSWFDLRPVPVGPVVNSSPGIIFSPSSSVLVPKAIRPEPTSLVSDRS